MASEIKLSFPATMSGLVASLEAIDHTGTTWNLDPGLVSRVRLIVEELFSNTIKYGYGAESVVRSVHENPLNKNSWLLTQMLCESTLE